MCVNAVLAIADLERKDVNLDLIKVDLSQKDLIPIFQKAASNLLARRYNCCAD